MEQNEQKYWMRFLNKNISLVKLVDGKELFYRGVVKAVFADKIILDDRKIGDVPLVFEGLSVIEINEEQNVSH